MNRLSRLDGLRGVLAVYVLLGHAAPFVVLPGWARGLVQHGEAAVDLFFCLSGLVVVGSLERFGFRIRPFLGARGRRLLPVYFVVLGLAVGLLGLGSPLAAMPWVAPGSAASQFWAFGLPAGFGWHLAAHVLLLQGLVPQGALPWAYITLLGPAWSLSTEWQFYLVMALVMRRWANLAGLAYGLAGTAVLYRLFGGFLPPWWSFSRAFLPDAAGYFALGLAVAVWRRGGGRRVFWLILALVCGLAITSGEVSKVLIPLGWGVALLAQFRADMPLLPAILDSRAVQYLGAISYPLYLLNEPVQRGLAMALAPLSHGSGAVFTALWLPAAILAPVLAAMALHHAVERPAMRGVSMLRWSKEASSSF